MYIFHLKRIEVHSFKLKIQEPTHPSNISAVLDL